MWEWKEIDTFGDFNYLELVKYALILTRMGLTLLTFLLRDFWLFERLCMVGEIVCEMKGKEIETFGNFNEMQLLKYALMLARMGLAILNC